MSDTPLGRLIGASLGPGDPELITRRAWAALGAGADIVSGGELERSLRAGIPGERIVFSGVGKTLRRPSLTISA